MSVRALIVDDDPDIRFIAGKILETAEIAVDEAGSAEEMFELLDGGAKPDVILLDLTMPGPSGWKALSERRSPSTRRSRS
jgi:CheY-like chemotaxis protein